MNEGNRIPIQYGSTNKLTKDYGIPKNHNTRYYTDESNQWVYYTKIYLFREEMSVRNKNKIEHNYYRLYCIYIYVWCRVYIRYISKQNENLIIFV